MVSARLVSVVMPVYQNGHRALSAVQYLLAQQLPEFIDVEIVVVDDGSRDRSTDVIRDLSDERVRLLRLPENRGRSAARNAGAQSADGEYLVFMDSDCLPDTTTFLAEHVDVLSRGFVASVGHVFGAGSGFWHRYQQDASARREKQHRAGHTYSGSSQNLAALKSAFDRAGAFDTRYRHYGFEDRDLLLRLRRQGNVGWAENASVYHMDILTLPGVCRKMMEAGQYGAARFASLHADAYRELGYAAIDARQTPWLRPLGILLGPALPTVARMVDRVLEYSRVPYVPAKAAVKALAALSFLYGTTRSEYSVGLREPGAN